MASTPFPIVLHDHTKAGIRWRVSIHPEIERGPGITVVRFLKHGRHGKLLDQLCTWSTDGWQGRPSVRVPRVLVERIERELQARNRPPRPPVPLSEQRMRGSRFPGVTEAVSCGRMPFAAFLAMELVEAFLPDPYRRRTSPQAH